MSVRSLFFVLVALLPVVDGPLPMMDGANRAVVAVRVDGAGRPFVVLTNGLYEPARIANPSLPANFAAHERIRASALAAADFDEDGIADVVAGYAAPGGGLLGVRLGNIGAFIPYRDGSRIDNRPSAYTDDIRLFDTSVSPDFIATGDFDADGHLDLLVASRADSVIELHPGDGRGGFGTGTHRALHGRVTALASGDVNRRDGLADVAVGIAARSQNALLILESTRGSFSAEPETIPLQDAPSGIAIANVDDEYAVDVVVAAGSTVTFVSGRDRRLQLDAWVRPFVGGADLSHVDMGEGIAALAVGNFVGPGRRDIAVLTSEGELRIVDGDSRSVIATPYRFASAAVGFATLTTTRIAAQHGDDLLIRDDDGERLHLLHARHFAAAEAIAATQAADRADPPARFGEAGARDLPMALPAPLVFQTSDRPAAVVTRRINGDGLHDVVLLSENEAPFVSDLSTTRTAPLAVWVVDDASNAADDDGTDGECLTAAGTCTLRAAVSEINRVDGPHEIRFLVTNIETTLADRHASLTKTTFIDGLSFGHVEIQGQFGNLAFTSNVPAGSVVRGMGIGQFIGYEGITLEGNYVGVDSGGDDMRDGSGLNIFGPGAVIGGRTPELRNVVARMQIRGADAVVEGNYVGTNADGTIGFFQNVNGIDAQDPGNVNITIGGTEAGAGNLIAGFGDVVGSGIGLRISGDGGLVQGNLFGTDATGSFAIPNSWDNISATDDVLIGGTVPGARNVIAAAGQYGIRLTTGIDASPVVKNNYVGTDVTGKVAMGNILGGISIGETNATIGGPDGPNVISGNGGPGIDIQLDNESGPDFIHSNHIGTDVSGVEPLPNGAYGIDTISETGVEIGGSPALGNVIAFNAEGGVNSFRRGVSIRGNAIFANAELGITLRNSASPDNNDANDVDDEQNYPVLTNLGDGQLLVELNSRAGETFTIDLYANESCDATGHGEGKIHLQSFELTTDGSGNASATIAPAVAAPTNVVTATATASDNSTSEFSECATIELPTVAVRALQNRADPRPIVHQTFEYGTFESIDSDADGSYERYGVATSDESGVLKLDATLLSPGAPFYLRAKRLTTAASKPDHGAVDNTLYTLYVDNLEFNATGTLLVPPTLSADPQATTDTYVERGSVGFNLVVAVEWDPVGPYADDLIAAFRSASNLMLDVTDGHAFIENVAFYSNAEGWRSADIRFHPDNTVWPSATRNGSEDPTGSVDFPPVSLGSPERNVVYATAGYPLNPNQRNSYATIVHELFHYLTGLLDEYLDGEGNELEDGVNWGIMDNQYDTGDRASELWWEDTPGYRTTRQWALASKTGWQAFADRYSVVDGAFDARIEVPTFRRPGPNGDSGNPDFNVGASLTTIDNMSRRSGDAVIMQVTAGGSPASGAFVEVLRQDGRSIRQGKTVQFSDPELDGAIVLRGADAGDRLLVSLSNDPYDWFSADEVVPSTGKRSDFVVVLRKNEGNYSLLPSLTFEGADAYSLSFTSPGEPAPAPPTLSAQFFDKDGVVVQSAASAVPGGFAFDLTAATVSRSPFSGTLAGEDENAAAFLVPGTLESISVDGDGRAETRTLQFELALEDTTSVDRIAVYASDFPVPRGGLPDSVARVTSVFALAGYPAESEISGEVRLYWQAGALLASVEDAVNLYRWDGGWQVVDTRGLIDSTRQSITAQISAGGTYAAFLDLTRTTMVGVERSGDGRQSTDPSDSPDRVGLATYPQPAGETAIIEVTLSAPGRVHLEVFDVIGRRVATLLDETLEAGVTNVTFDTGGLPAGLYFARLSAGGEEAVVRIVKG